MRTGLWSGLYCFLLMNLAACSAPPVPASTPGPEPMSAAAPAAPEARAPEARAPEAKPSSAEPEAMADAGGEDPEPTPEPEADPASKPSKPPSAVLTQADTDFLLDDSASDLKTALKAECQAKAKDAADTAAIAECVQKARDEFSADVLSFQGDPAGAVRLVIYRRKASQLTEVYSASVKLADAGETRVTVTPKGAAKGQRPVFKGQRELSIEVPDDYSLALQDPKWGKLSYRAKYGLVAR